MGNFNIRWARAKDARSIAALWHRVWHATYSRHFTADALKLCTLNLFERRVGASLFEVDASLPIDERVIRPTALVAEGNDSALHGFAVLRGGAELEHLYVDPALHGTALGSSLLAASERILHTERGCDVAHLVVSVRNRRAVRFYERHGWVGSPPQQPWMSTAPWEAVRPPHGSESAEDDGGGVDLIRGGGLTEEELIATKMRCTQMKKWLGYEQPPVPRMRSSLATTT